MSPLVEGTETRVSFITVPAIPSLTRAFEVQKSLLAMGYAVEFPSASYHNGAPVWRVCGSKLVTVAVAL